MKKGMAKIMIRLFSATLVIVCSWYAYDALQMHSFKITPAAVLFYLFGYFFLVSALYAISSMTRAPSLGFVVLFVGVHGVFFYFGYSAYDRYELAGRAIVVNGRLTALGWQTIATYEAVAIVSGIAAAFVLFRSVYAQRRLLGNKQ